MKVKRSSKAGAKIGRPRAFDTDKALERALQVFWRRGYQGASLADLTRAMGINRPSLYAAFGNKEALFRKALELYHCGPAGYVNRALGEPTARAVAEALLRGAAGLLADRRHPRGCLMVQGALSCGDAADPIRRELNARRAAGEARVRDRLDRAKAVGDLPPGSDPVSLALFLSAVTQGMAVQAAGGAGSKQLEQVIVTAMRAWPD